MAVDTRSKRQSACGVTLPWLRTPAPDGSLAAVGDRQHIAWSYSGISSSAATPVEPVITVPPAPDTLVANLKVYQQEASVQTYELIANRAAFNLDASLE